MGDCVSRRRVHRVCLVLEKNRLFTRLKEYLLVSHRFKGYGSSRMYKISSSLDLLH